MTQGMLQHAIFTIPNRAEGYTTDDNARALIFTVLMNQLGMDQLNLGQASASPARDRRICQSRLGIPVFSVSGSCLQSREEKIPKLPGLRPSLDGRPGTRSAHGRALWALGTLLARSTNIGLRGAAGRLFENIADGRRLSFTVRVRAPIPCLEFRSTSIRTLATGTPSAYDSL